jgi:hypothetical protein
MPFTSHDPSRPIRRVLAAVLACGLAAGMAACGPSPASPSASALTAGASAGAPSPEPASVTPSGTGPELTQAPPPTPIVAVSPGTSVESAEPTDPPDVPGGGTTQTPWGRILDSVPEGFPVYPGASPADAPDGPVSGAWLARDGIDVVVRWYQTAFADAGYSNGDLSTPGEDGSLVLDTVSDLPECQIRTTFRPAAGSTMIRVLYGAGCAGGQG